MKCLDCDTKKSRGICPFCAEDRYIHAHPEQFPMFAGPAAPLADLPFALTPEIASTPRAERLQRHLRFEP